MTKRVTLTISVRGTNTENIGGHSRIERLLFLSQTWKGGYLSTSSAALLGPPLCCMTGQGIHIRDSAITARGKGGVGTYWRRATPSCIYTWRGGVYSKRLKVQVFLQCSTTETDREQTTSDGTSNSDEMWGGGRAEEGARTVDVSPEPEFISTVQTRGNKADNTEGGARESGTGRIGDNRYGGVQGIPNGSGHSWEQ